METTKIHFSNGFGLEAGFLSGFLFYLSYKKEKYKCGSCTAACLVILKWEYLVLLGFPEVLWAGMDGAPSL